MSISIRSLSSMNGMEDIKNTLSSNQFKEKEYEELRTYNLRDKPASFTKKRGQPTSPGVNDGTGNGGSNDRKDEQVSPTKNLPHKKDICCCVVQ